jgi:uncharacterized protein
MIPQINTPVSLNHADAYLELWQATPQHSIDYTLANIWGWGLYFGLEWRMSNGLCWLCQSVPAPVRWAPVGNWHAVDWKNAPELEQGGLFVRVPEQLALLWQQELGERVQLEEARGHWEYLYAQEDLAQLAGKRFHKKKNHVNAYIKEYGTMDYRPLTEAVREDVLILQDEWCQWHECDDSSSLKAENEAINRVLAHWDAIPGLVGGALYVRGTIAAFSVGEQLDSHSLGVHYEKGRNGIRGVYQSMNQAFASHAGEGYAVLNRAQDLDEEGLRQAKMTYSPVDFLRKYTVRVLPKTL